MEKKLSKRISVFLLVITLLVSFAFTTLLNKPTQIVNASEISSRSDTAPTLYYPAGTLDPFRPEKRELESWLKELDEAGKKKEQQKKEKQEDITNAISATKMILPSLIKLVSDPENADYTSEIYNMAFSGIRMVCSNIPGWGTAITAGLDIVDSLLKIGENKTSELQLLEQRLNDQFDAVKDDIAEVKREIADLSDKLSESTNEIIKELDNSFEAHVANERLTEFTSSSEGNFDYYQFKNYLYGSTDASANPNGFRQAYASKLDEVSINTSIEELKYYYDELYKSLESIQHGESNINMFYDYLLYDSTGISPQKPIVYYYYEYLLANEHLLQGGNAEKEAIMFAYDLYLTAIRAEQCIDSCNSFQTMYLARKYGENLSDASFYEFGDERITYGEIKKTSDASTARIELLRSQMAVDICYLLNMANSFAICNAEDDDLRYVNKSSEDTYGLVEVESKIHMNTLPNFVYSLFDLEHSDFTYKWFKNGVEILNNGGEYISDGIYTVTNGYQEFEGAFYYKDIKVYSIDFRLLNGTSFSGGDGTQEAPYQISNAEQFMLIYKEHNTHKKHYELIADIDLGGQNISPIGNKEYAFEGSFNGNGHAISNFNIKNSNYGGLFGYIHADGYVYNLKLSNAQVEVSNNDEVKLVAGVFAGICNGTIERCAVLQSSLKVNRDSNEKSKNLNKAIYAYGGGLVGELSGTILESFCESTTVNVISKRHYQSDRDSMNKNYVYAGGIVGFMDCGAGISKCYVDSASKIECLARSTCFDNMSTRHPYATAYAGGVVGKSTQGSIIEKVYSATIDSEIKASATRENTSGFFGGSVANNCISGTDIYIGKLEENVVFTQADSLTALELSGNVDFDITYAFNCLRNSDYGYCYEDQIYNCGDQKLNVENLIILSEDIPLTYEIVAYYNFDTINSDKLQSIKNDVILLLAVEYEGDVYYKRLVLPITIKKNMPIDIDFEVPEWLERTTYNNSEYVLYKTTDTLLSKSEIAYLVYQDGSKEQISVDQISHNFDPNVFGLQNLTLTYGDFSWEYSVVVECGHSVVDSENEEYWKAEAVAPTCYQIGFTRHTCLKCGYVYRDALVTEKPEHSYVMVNQKQAACTENGYTGDLQCSEPNCRNYVVCGEEIHMIGHDFVCLDNDNTYHVCNRDGCSKLEEHVVSSIDNSNGKIIRFCSECDYLEEVDSIQLTSIPRVIVSDGYVLAGGLVEIKVQILNNPGITGASFSVLYDPVLEYVGFEQGNVLSGGKFTPNHVKPGVFAFTVYRAGTDYTNGNFCKLIFRAPKDVNLSEEFNIDVSYTRSDAQFTDYNADAIDILTLPGVITVVDHLPGDVNNDGCVDVLDTALISLYFNNINGEDQEINKILENAGFDIAYADVDLSGKAGLEDVVTMVRYIVGGYDAQILNNEFRITLNFNDGTSKTEIITVKCFDDEGNRLTYSNLPIPQRDGYRFEGWYTRLDASGKLIENGSKISYDKDQYSNTHKQILYARWTLNEISFDGNGGVGDFDKATYVSNGEKLVLNFVPTRTETVSYYDNIDGKTELILPPETLEYEFLGWAASPDGQPIYHIGDEINLKQSQDGIGKLNLYAVWAEKSIILLDPPELAGKQFLGWQVGTSLMPNGSQYIVTESVDIIARRDFITFYIEYDKNADDATGVMDIQEINSKDGAYLYSCGFDRIGYTFNGWKTESGQVYSTSQIITHIGNINDGETVTLYADWEGIDYKITYAANTDNLVNLTSIVTGVVEKGDYKYGQKDTITAQKYSLNGYIFKGWSTVPNPTNSQKIYISGAWLDSGEINPNGLFNITLYAVWEIDIYNIGKYVSKNGVVVSDTDGTNEYLVYNTIYNGSSLDLTASRVILDWRGQTDANTFRVTTGRNVIEVVFIGDRGRTYNNITTIIPHFASAGHHQTWEFVDFSFNVSTSNHLYECEKFTLEIKTTGICEIGTNVAGGSVFDMNGADLLFTGPGTMSINGGNGAQATTAGGHGSNGGTAIIADRLTVDKKVKLTIKGGDGSDGANGKNQGLGTADSNPPSTATTAGGAGGNGGNAVQCSSLSVINNSNVHFIGGNGGKGGNGGNVTGTGSYTGYADLPDGGNGGKGGNGGMPINSTVLITISKNAELQLQYGNGGKGGDGGNGGDAGWPDNGVKPDGWGHGGNAGQGGFGYNGGGAGTGGIGGSSFTNWTWNVWPFSKTDQIGTTGNGGTGNSGGNSMSSVIYKNGTQTLEYGIVGAGGAGGSCGEQSGASNGKTVNYGTDRSGTIGSAGTQTECTYQTVWLD